MNSNGMRWTVALAAVALFAAPQFSLAEPAADVSPTLKKAARIQKMNSQMRVTHEQRVEAAKSLKATKARVEAARAAAIAKGIEVPQMGLRAVPAGKRGSALRAGATRSDAIQLPAGVAPPGPFDIPDYFTTANWAFSPTLKKFVDTLPGLGPTAASTLDGHYIPVAVADTTTYPGSDYYEIAVREYQHRFHSDLPAPGTTVRGYVQTNVAGAPVINWLGPVIVAQQDRPVRVKFTNELPPGAGGNLNIPVDETIMGSGQGPLDAAGAVCDPSPPNGGGCALFPQNRAAIHLHGGRTPWISDGTPHQWILPLGDYNDPQIPYKQGVSLFNVPDMPDPGPGSTTYYWSNQQSARLMFYHDHAWGITRLNVMVGEAAGIVITDAVEQQLITEGVLPGIGTPLVIQDRTFVDATLVPSPFVAGQTIPRVRATDPTWNSGSGVDPGTGILPPVTGDFWIPHVYIPAQNPYDVTGVNPFGRWVYGPWFFPPTANLIFPPIANPYFDANCGDPDPAVYAFCTTPGQPPVIPATPLPSVGAETFMDTMLVNGVVFPTVTVDPKAYRFRILNAANDRMVNLNIYVADTAAASYLAAPYDNIGSEVKMVPAECINWNTALYPQWPCDGRAEGIPDPANLGPDIIYIGTEGGFLPRPVVLKGQPITFVTDPTAFNVGNVLDYNMMLGNAERADVIMDFSAFAGKTLILYNDSPAAVPAFDPRFDYLANAPDLSENGGYGEIPFWAAPGSPDYVKKGPQPGYGPGTRTVLQIKVANTTPAAPYDVNALFARWAPTTTPVSPRNTTLGVFEQAQDGIIVGQADYNGIYSAPVVTFPSVWPAWGLARIEDNFLTFATLGGTVQTFPMEPKAIHDEMGASFDKEYGRMSTNLGMTTPIPKTNNANMTPFMYPDPATEIMNAAVQPISPVLGDGTQIWKISHNGVDMHPVHFHIFDVQVINRVGWDGQIRRPYEQELGWKDTVKISPLEDTIVAMRPWTPPLPFQIPNSLRPLNPSIPIGSGFGFTNIDPITQNPLVPPTLNRVDNFAWEYVWHCHILSHEENDMMRPIVLNVGSTIPPPIVLAPVITKPGGGNLVTWVDPTPVDYATQTGIGFGNLASEIGFRIERTTSTTANGVVIYPAAGASNAYNANKTTFLDTTAGATTYYRYRVVAWNEAGTSTSPWAVTGTPPVATRLTSVSLNVAPASPWTRSLTTVTTPVFTAQGVGGNPATYEYRFSIRLGAGAYAEVQAYSPLRTWTMPISQAPGSYTIQVEARNGPAVAPRLATRAYTVAIPVPVAGLTVDPGSPSPGLVGAPVVFTANPAGGAALRQFQFSLQTGTGAFVIVQPWSILPTWTLPAITPVGGYTVKAEVRTNSGNIDRTATAAYAIANPAATGVALAVLQVSPSVPPVQFLATGQGPAPLSSATGGGYFFQFSRSVGGGAFAVVQPWSTSRVYTMPVPTADGNYLVQVEVSTTAGTSQVPAVTSSPPLAFTVQNILPAGSVAFTPVPPTSGAFGTPVTFTAVAAGGGVSPVYSYRFTLDGGTPGAWGAGNTFTLLGTALGGTHTIKVDATTEAVPATAQATNTATYEVIYPAATGVTIDNGIPVTPSVYGTAVTFTAAGSSSVTLPTSAYKYRFKVDPAGTFGAWGSSATFSLPIDTLPGSHTVIVEVSTANTPAMEATATSAAYVIYAAPSVNISANPASGSGQLYGTSVTFTAVGSGGPPPVTSAYRFSLNGSVIQDWSASATYTSAALPVQSNTVLVEYSTAATPAVAATASTTYLISGYPAATGLAITATPAGPSAAGTSVTFTAAGSSSMVLPPSAYSYRFYISRDGGTAWTMVQSFGVGSSWTWTAEAAGAAPGGVFMIQAQVTTAIPATAQQMNNSYNFTVLP